MSGRKSSEDGSTFSDVSSAEDALTIAVLSSPFAGLKIEAFEAVEVAILSTTTIGDISSSDDALRISVLSSRFIVLDSVAFKTVEVTNASTTTFGSHVCISSSAAVSSSSFEMAR